MAGNRYEIRLSGSGGQGIILAAVVLAEAAGVYEGRYVCQTQSYGPEARGGASKAEIVISGSPIDYPKAIRPDLLIAMTQHSCDYYFKGINDDGILIVDSSLVEEIPTERAVAIPFTQIARNKLGNEAAANMIALGAAACLSGIVTQKGLEKSLKRRVPGKTFEVNLKALRTGFRAGRNIDIASLPKKVTPEEEEL